MSQASRSSDPTSGPDPTRFVLRASRRVYRLILYPFFFLSGFMPRNPHRWVFGARNGFKFEGNSKWLYLYVARHESATRAVWITRRKEIVEMLRKQGLAAYLATSPRGIWEQLRAGVFVVILNSPDINYWTKRGALLVNLQHGTPFKRFGRDVIDEANPLFENHSGSLRRRLAIRIGIPSTYELVDFVASLSRESSERWGSALGIPLDRVVETGYPRNDVLVADQYTPDPWDRAWFERLSAQRTGDRKLLAYLPTFRHAGGSETEAPIDWERLDQFLVEQNMHLWVRWHPGDARPVPDLARFAAIDPIPGDVDVDPLLRLTDLLITDYSSAYLDYLLLDRPIVFFAYDQREYLAAGKTLYEPYEDVTPGPKVESFDALLDTRERNGDDVDYAVLRAKLRRRTHAHLDAGASRRVYQSIRDRLSAR